MTDKLNLPAGYTSRAPTLDDLPATVELFNHCSMEMIGKHDFTLKEVENEWTTPGINIETDFRIVLSPEDELIGYVEVWTINDVPIHPWVWGRVHPAHKNKGIGTALLTWAEERARQVFDRVPAEARVAFRSNVIDTHKPGNDLLSGYGMDLIRYSFQMRIELTEAPPAPIWPDGIIVRTFRLEDIEAVYRADDEAFQDHFGYTPEDFEAGLARFKHAMLNDEGFAPDLWFLAMDGDEIAGFSLCRTHSWEDKNLGWVRDLAVRRPWRKRGLGLALLLHSFNASWQRGKSGVGLGVDGENLTGALKLYKKAGMTVYRQHNLYEKVLRAGKDLSTH